MSSVGLTTSTNLSTSCCSITVSLPESATAQTSALLESTGMSAMTIEKFVKLLKSCTMGLSPIVIELSDPMVQSDIVQRLEVLELLPDKTYTFPIAQDTEETVTVLRGTATVTTGDKTSDLPTYALIKLARGSTYHFTNKRTEPLTLFWHKIHKPVPFNAPNGPYIRKLEDCLLIPCTPKGEHGVENWGKFNGSALRGSNAFFLLEPGARSNGHYHKTYDEIYMVISGTGEVIVGSKKASVSAGNTIIIPRKTWHQVFCSEDALEPLALYIPCGPEPWHIDNTVFCPNPNPDPTPDSKV